MLNTNLFSYSSSLISKPFFFQVFSLTNTMDVYFTQTILAINGVFKSFFLFSYQSKMSGSSFKFFLKNSGIVLVLLSSWLQGY